MKICFLLFPMLLLSACVTDSSNLNSQYSKALNDTVNMSEYDKARYMSQKGFGNQYMQQHQNDQLFKMRQRENQPR